MQLKSITIRNGTPSDHENVIAVMPDWWGGRDFRSSVLKVFFFHFSNTTFIAEDHGVLVGFLVGFLSQSEEQVGYIHFVGVHPDYRRAAVARTLYQRFFDVCTANNRSIIKSCTSPVNKLSVSFHKGMGFELEPGDGAVDGLPVTMNYLRLNDHKILFKKKLE